ncbi:MAG: beta-propeller fold lactonase family protein, partial [Candidatus Manganitrophaceae bacterium]
MVFLFLLSMIGLAACGKLSDNKKGGTTPPTANAGKLYVANAGDGSLLAFDQATSAQGNISPSRRFPESITGPTGLFLDRSNDTLYVANTGHNSILIYENASTLNLSTGSADATRVISGPKTGLNHPFAVVYDATPGRERLYVANKDSNSISVFQTDCPETNILNGDIPPCRTLSGAATLLDLPRALAVDAQRDILYISNLGNNSILAYGNASQSATQGDLAPTRTISPHSDSSQTESMLHLPTGLFIDSANDRLYVLNTGRNQPAILIYENASTRSGEALPDRLFVGQSTQLTSPVGIDLFVDQDRLYVLNNNNTNNGSTAVMVFENFNSQCAASPCDFAPDRTITGQNTTLANPAGIAYDPTREIVYVANTLANDVLIFTLEGNLIPLKTNTGPYQTTGLLQPNGFFYDEDLDRLYIANFNAGSANLPPIIVYENASTKLFPGATAPDWAIRGNDIQQPRSVYVDKTRQYLIVLNRPIDKVVIYDLAAISNATTSGGAITTLQSLNVVGTLLGEDSSNFDIGFIRGTAMAVDEAGGLLYVAADCDASSDCPNQQPNGNSIFIYNLNSLSDPPHVIGRGCVDRDNANPNNKGCETFDNIKLNRPFGLHYDSDQDILYVTNAGPSGATANTLLAFHNPSNLGDTLANCNQNVIDNPTAPSACASVSPNRIISSSTSFDASEQMQTPTAPYVNTAADRLFLINWAKNSLFIFENASTLSGTTRPDRIISGADTKLAFSGTGNFTGALFVDTSQGKEIIYVGQPKEPGCTTCLDGAFLVFGVEGNVPPSRTWSGGSAALVGPAALAVDTSRDILYVANQGDADLTTDDSLSLFTEASEANGNLPMTGTLSVTDGSDSVTGSGTIFTTEFAAGDSIKIETTTYTIASIESDSAMTLTTPYSGTTASGLPASLRPRSLCSPSSSTCGAPDVKLNNPAGLFVDPERNHLYISNTGDPNCSDVAM